MFCLYVQNMYLIHYYDHDMNLLPLFFFTRMHENDTEDSRKIIPLMHRPLKLKYPSWQKQNLFLSTYVSVQFNALSVPLHCSWARHVSNNLLPTMNKKQLKKILGMPSNPYAQQKYTVNFLVRKVKVCLGIKYILSHFSNIFHESMQIRRYSYIYLCSLYDDRYLHFLFHCIAHL